MNERTREWIHKPVINGVPVSYLKEYIRGVLVKFRNKHKEFDEFLMELRPLLDSDNNHGDYSNIISFIGGEGDPNWISTPNSIFAMMIKLFNLDLSPKQAFDYIKSCHKYYLKMVSSDYHLNDEYQISIRRSRCDGKARKFIEVDMIPTLHEDNSYWFNISFCDLVDNDRFNDIMTRSDLKIDIRTSDERYKDALQLFVFYQHRDLLFDIFDKTISELTDKMIVDIVREYDHYGWRYFECDIKGEVGHHKLSILKQK